jgi:hypothetical protein
MRARSRLRGEASGVRPRHATGNSYGVLFLATGVIEITQRFCIYFAAEGEGVQATPLEPQCGSFAHSDEIRGAVSPMKSGRCFAVTEK